MRGLEVTWANQQNCELDCTNQYCQNVFQKFLFSGDHNSTLGTYAWVNIFNKRFQIVCIRRVHHVSRRQVNFELASVFFMLDCH